MQWILLVMKDAPLRQLYVDLLQRRGHGVHATGDAVMAAQVIGSEELALIIVDDEVESSLDGGQIQQWTHGDEGPLLIALNSPETSKVSETAPWSVPPPAGVDLVLQKPLSPMEFGIQVDHLLEPTSKSTLDEDSRAEREFGTMRQEFIVQLDEDLSQLQHIWSDLEQSLDAPMRPASRLKRHIGPIRAAARHFGFVHLADELTAFESFVRRFMTPEATVDELGMRRANQLLGALRERCRVLQNRFEAELPTLHSTGINQTLLVIDSDSDYLAQVEEFGEQFMIRIRTATTLEEAIDRVRTPLLTGVLLSLSATSSPSQLAATVEALQEASPLNILPIALVGDSGRDLNKVRSLWAGASALIAKPLTAITFARTAQRLATLRRSLKSKILILEPRKEVAARLIAQLDDQDTTVYLHDPHISVFEELDNRRPDLLIIDVHLQGISSFDLCRGLRSVPRWQDIPLIMISETDLPEMRLAAYQAGADDFFTHQISSEEIKARVQSRIQRAQLFRERADRDLLTGLLTRRPFLEQLTARLSEVARHDRNLVFSIFDLDHFKEVNDVHGHLVGDRVLQTLGQLLQDRFRVEDLRARWGGEEFIVVLIDEDAATAQQAIRRVLDEFSKIDFIGHDGQLFHVTFSAGIAMFPTDGTDAETLLSTADSRLLRAKRSGRNTIEMGVQYA